MLEALQRRLRKLLKTSDVNALVEELLIGLGDDNPAEFPNGIELTMGEDNTAVTVRNYSPNDPWVNFRNDNKKLDPINWTPNRSGGGSGDGSGGGGGTSGTSIFQGVITGGSGTSYLVNITTANGIQNVPVTLVGGDTAITFPTGTPVIVFKAGSFYLMQITAQLTGVIAGGSGDTYTVNLDDSMGTVTVTQLQISASESIPIGTAVAVSRSITGAFTINVPVLN